VPQETSLGGVEVAAPHPGAGIDANAQDNAKVPTLDVPVARAEESAPSRSEPSDASGPPGPELGAPLSDRAAPSSQRAQQGGAQAFAGNGQQVAAGAAMGNGAASGANAAREFADSDLPPADGMRLLEDQDDLLDDNALKMELAVHPANAAVRKPMRSGPPSTARPRSRAGQEPSFKAQFMAPLVVICAGIAVALVGRIYAGVAGEVFSVGGIQPRYVAGALVVIGVVFFTLRIIANANAGERSEK